MNGEEHNISPRNERLLTQDLRKEKYPSDVNSSKGSQVHLEVPDSGRPKTEKPYLRKSKLELSKGDP